MSDHRQVHMHDQRQVHHNPSSSSTDPNPPMAIEQPVATAPPAEEIVPSKLTHSRKKAPTSEAGLAQARLVANLIDGFQQVRAAHRAQVQADRRLPIEDQASASAAAAPRVPESSSASAAAAPATPKGSSSSAAKGKSASAAAPRGRASSRTPPSKEDVAGQLTDVSKRGRSSTRTPAQGRNETPEFPLEGTVLISDIANKKAKRNPQEIMRKHYKENRGHFRAKKKITLPISKRRPT